MLGFDDAVALSTWSALPRRDLPAIFRWASARAPGSPVQSGGAASDVPFEILLTWLGAGDEVCALAAALRAAAGRALADAARVAASFLAYGDARFPALLAAIPDPPVGIWVRGSLDLLAGPSVAVVGSRAASPYGLAIAETLGSSLVAGGLVVVSGLARGVDSAAHRGALAAGGRTVAVLGAGIDIVYPPEHASLTADLLARGGAIVSEYAPGTPPRPGHFPMRNRIISGLSLGVVVVEAAEKSGSLITAGLALDQGREVMAVPGPVLSGRHAGSHRLIKDGAALVENAADVQAVIAHLPRPALAVLPADRGGDDPILAVLEPDEPVGLDALVTATGLETSAVLARLMALELGGRVRRVAGGRFVRDARTC